MACSIPPEVLDLIVDHLHDEWSTLKICCVTTQIMGSEGSKAPFCSHPALRSRTSHRIVDPGLLRSSQLSLTTHTHTPLVDKIPQRSLRHFSTKMLSQQWIWCRSNPIPWSLDISSYSPSAFLLTSMFCTILLPADVDTSVTPLLHLSTATNLKDPASECGGPSVR